MVVAGCCGFRCRGIVAVFELYAGVGTERGFIADCGGTGVFRVGAWGAVVAT
jgi:hypothetical protein